MPLLKCATSSEVKYIMREIHEGTCGNHARGQSLAFKAHTRLLLANYEDGLHGVRLQMRQVQMIFANIESPSRKAYIHDQPVAICRLGNRPNWPTSQRER